MVFTNIETAEVTKYAGNAFLATKITFINEIADLCEKVGADVHDVARGIGLDGRIGRKFLHPGPGFGGSCFPKDTLALAYTAREVNAPQTIVEQVIEVNNARKKRMAAQGHRLLRRLGDGPDGRRARPHLQAQHRRHARRALARHRAGAAGGRREDRGLRSRGHGRRPASCCRASPSPRPPTRRHSSADVLVVITEWHEFRGLDPRRIKQVMRQPRIVDLRNIFNPEEMRGLGFTYEGVGRPQPRN